MYGSLKYGAQWTNGQTDAQKKWHREVGVPPKNKLKSEIFNEKKVINKNIFLCNNLEFKLGNSD